MTLKEMVKPLDTGTLIAMSRTAESRLRRTREADHPELYAELSAQFDAITDELIARFPQQAEQAAERAYTASRAPGRA